MDREIAPEVRQRQLTKRVAVAKSARPVTLAGFPLGTAISSLFRAKVTGDTASVTWLMFFGAAEADAYFASRPLAKSA